MSLDVYVLTPIEHKEYEFGDILLSGLSKEVSEIFEKILPNCTRLDTTVYYDYKKHWLELGYKESPQIRLDYENNLVEYHFWNDIVGNYKLIEPISSIPILERGELYEVYVKTVDGYDGSSYDFKDDSPPNEFYTIDNLSEFIGYLKDEFISEWNNISEKEIIYLER